LDMLLDLSWLGAEPKIAQSCWTDLLLWITLLLCYFCFTDFCRKIQIDFCAQLVAMLILCLYVTFMNLSWFYLC
jgi:hypothetical protein